MRRRIWISCTIVLLICLLLVLRKTSEIEKTTAPGQVETLTNQSNQEINQIKGRRETLNVKPSTPTRKEALPSQPSPLEISNARNQELLSEWRAPIEFYGKVVDENTNPIVDASVGFSWDETPWESGDKTSSIQSDSAGLFLLQGVSGRILNVTVSKAGYYASHSGSQSFRYSMRSEVFRPDPANPVVFTLRKKGLGEPLIEKKFPTGMGQIAQLRHDGTSVEINLLNGEKAIAGTGQLKLEFWRDLSDRKARIFDWKLQLSMAGGGFVETADEFAFQAPEGGYQSPIVIDMSTTNQNWLSEIRSKILRSIA